MSTDSPFEQRLHALYAVSVPAELDRRVAATWTMTPIRLSGRSRPRILAALAVAAIVVTAAAGPALEWFANWHSPFDRLWEISTAVDQTVTADGYRVTVHRAYADRFGVRLAITVEDEQDRWSEFAVDGAEVTDTAGRVYEGWNWSGSKTPVDGSSATWSRFLLPAGVGADKLQLQVRVTSLAARAPEPIPVGLAPERIWTSVSGAWDFEVNVPVTQGHSISPVANATTTDITINLEELGVVPSGTVVRFAVNGLPEAPGGSVNAWYPVTSIEHDGERLTDDVVEPGVLGSDGSVTLEVVPVVEDLAGHWRITVLSFHSFDPIHERFGDIQGPWVLEFDVTP
ncbi:MAG: DUF4179 domain-containing protein [Chloroflexota bacterium]